MIIELPGYIDLDTVAEIREAVKPLLPKTKTHVYNRDGYTVNISEQPSLKELDNKLAGIFRKLQDDVVAHRYKPQYASGDSGYEYHIYEPGDVCHIHCDGEITRRTNGGLLRYASVVIHLSTLEDGGELVFPTQNTSVKTEAGKVVIFPPYGMFQHYTTPSTQPREVIVTWFVYNGITVIPNANSRV
jgi:predicted 2-oxoglutarate/Fe(II)-dependent dioxygenase YbiX